MHLRHEFSRAQRLDLLPQLDRLLLFHVVNLPLQLRLEALVLLYDRLLPHPVELLCQALVLLPQPPLLHSRQLVQLLFLVFQPFGYLRLVALPGGDEVWQLHHVSRRPIRLTI